MIKLRIRSRLVVGLLLFTMTACEPLTVQDPEQSSNQVTPAASQAAETSIARQAETATPTNSVEPTSSPPPAPTAAPTTSILDTWQQIGGAANGMQLNAPPNWVNLSGQLDTPAVANELGLIVLLLADTPRTGSSLLAGKAIGEGAYAAGMISHFDLPPNTPQASLNRLVEQLNPPRSPLSEPQLITIDGVNDRITGAYIDISGAPLIFPVSSESPLRTRLFMFTTLSGAVNQQTQALFLMSAPEESWSQYQGTFSRMANTIIVHNLYADVLIRDGSATVVGELNQSDVVNGELRAGVKDVWTFTVAETPRYATLSLNAEQSGLDMTFNLISPIGQTVLQVDNGYAGVTESAIDVALIKPGVYVVEVGEFFNLAGRYTLSLVLTNEPLFGGGGDIRVGQTIQSTLPVDGQQVWHFNGDAGDPVSIVLTPEGIFDPILELFGPDGRKLAGLDEGFSGDAELLTGFSLPLTGQYTILVRSFAGDGGDYALSLDAGGENTSNFYDAGDLRYGQSATENLQLNEAHAWFFAGREGDNITITATPLAEQLDLDIWLLDPDIERLTAQDALLAGEPESLTYTLPRDGQFIILVRDFFGEPGSYQIQLDADTSQPPADMGLVGYGDTINSALAANQEVIWRFDAAEGDTINVQLEPGESDVDLILELVAPNGSRILLRDDTETGEMEQLFNYQIMGNGRYGLIVREFFGEAVSYTLTINRRP